MLAWRLENPEAHRSVCPCDFFLKWLAWIVFGLGIYVGGACTSACCRWSWWWWWWCWWWRGWRDARNEMKMILLMSRIGRSMVMRGFCRWWWWWWWWCYCCCVHFWDLGSVFTLRILGRGVQGYRRRAAESFFRMIRLTLNTKNPAKQSPQNPKQPLSPKPQIPKHRNPKPLNPKPLNP